jgi:hypothetical protein
VINPFKKAVRQENSTLKQKIIRLKHTEAFFLQKPLTTVHRQLIPQEFAKQTTGEIQHALNCQYLNKFVVFSLPQAFQVLQAGTVIQLQ